MPRAPWRLARGRNARSAVDAKLARLKLARSSTRAEQPRTTRRSDSRARLSSVSADSPSPRHQPNSRTPSSMAPLRTSTPDSAVEYTRNCRSGAQRYRPVGARATLSFATARHGTRDADHSALSFGVRSSATRRPTRRTSSIVRSSWPLSKDPLHAATTTAVVVHKTTRHVRIGLTPAHQRHGGRDWSRQRQFLAARMAS